MASSKSSRSTVWSAQAVTGVIVYGSFINSDRVGGGSELFRQDRLAPGATRRSNVQQIAIANRAGSFAITATVTAFAADLAVVTQTATLTLSIEQPQP